MVLAEMFREYRQKKQEQRVRESVAEHQARWEAWLARLEEAKKNSLPFTEPPPSLEDAENGSAI